MTAEPRQTDVCRGSISQQPVCGKFLPVFYRDRVADPPSGRYTGGMNPVRDCGSDPLPAGNFVIRRDLYAALSIWLPVLS